MTSSIAPAVVATRMAGVIPGAAIGDALGYPIEFASMATIRKCYGEAGVTGDVEYRFEDGHHFAPFVEGKPVERLIVVLEH